mmetsp:Transcript_81173/g.210878  ORF Transcript_81173/g.210878 Transcript_81173/m.210878 type:complete len:973 (+) Transcript_81173:131-3049(+)
MAMVAGAAALPVPSNTSPVALAPLAFSGLAGKPPSQLHSVGSAVASKGSLATRRDLALLAAAGVSVAGAASSRRLAGGRRRSRFAGRGRPGAVHFVARRATEIVVSVPDIADLQKQAEAELGSLSSPSAEAVNSLAVQLQGLAAGVELPQPPEALKQAIDSLLAIPEVRAAADTFSQQANALLAALPAAMPAELSAALADPALAVAAQPAGAGALLVWLLALRRGKQWWAEELPLRYDGPWIEAYWMRRPFKLLKRFIEVGFKIGAFSTAIEIDKALGKDEENMPQRAVEARELITDLGPTFVKITQVWASRPDVLPEAYQKECEKLLEQVRPFNRELAMETLRRNITGSNGVERMFDDMAVFDEPIAAASVGQVYKANMNGRDVAVKVQRPDVREQVTLDLFVVRRLSGLGSQLPIERYAAQFKSLLELLDRAAPPFIEELDYENEASNQRRFAKMTADCELIRDNVAVPEVFFSSREVLVQEWLPGKKLTEPGAAQEQAGRVVKVLLNSYMVQFLETGFLHGDPHPGNFILMPDGRLGILDYGLMTTISPEKRVAFIEYIMHVQAKMYDECLQDLVNLEFLPAGIADDKEAREVIVPGLANTLSILYEGSGDLREQQKKFIKQREDLQATGKLEVLRGKLQAIAKKYGSFRLPGYMTLILRAFATLEGVGLRTDKQFSIIKECFPYVARRLLTDDSLRIREALKAYLYRDGRRIKVKRIDDLASGFGNFTNLMKGSRKEAVEAGAPIAAADTAALVVAGRGSGDSTEDEETPPVVFDTASRDIIAVLFSPQGNFLQEVLIDEAVAAIDALSRAALVQLLKALGPLAMPLRGQLSFMLGSPDFSRTESVILTRDDKESLLLLRRIAQLIQEGSSGRPDASSSASSEHDGGAADAGVRSVDLLNVFRDLQRLGPIASGLLPTVAPGVTAFARRLVVQLGSRTLLRLANDLERGSAGGRRASAMIPAAATTSR